MRGAREAPVPRDSLNFRRSSLLSRNEFESGTFTILLHATSSFTYVSVIYGANFPFNPVRIRAYGGRQLCYSFIEYSNIRSFRKDSIRNDLEYSF